MAQYLEIKAANPDCLLWYRMGDFYELFFEDAVTAATALGIVLTKRGKHLGSDIPMCGVPVHRADEYLQRLIRLGFRIAVCEQLEDPAEARKRGSKAVVRRDVVRLVTPGTLTEDALLDARARNYLTALHKVAGPQADVRAPGDGAGVAFALASLDISTGELEVGSVSAADLGGELVRLQPSELIAADMLFADAAAKPWIDSLGTAATPVPAASFDAMAGERSLKARLGVGDLSAFGAFSRGELAAIGAVLRYVELTQIGRQPIVRPPRRTGPASVLVIDASTRASLEIARSTSGERSGSLLGAIDRTVTGAGARELAARLASPLRTPAIINARLDAVAWLTENALVREALRAQLRAAPDIARAVSRLALQRGSPRDLVAIRDGLAAAAGSARTLADAAGPIGLPGELASLGERLATADTELQRELARALVDEPPPVRRDGGFVRAGYMAELDDSRRLRDDSRKVLIELEAKYLAETSLRTLKVRHNNQIGYYVEVGAQPGKALLEAPLNATFRHRQTLPNQLRFTTAELSEIEGRISAAADRAQALENEVFNALAKCVAEEEARLLGIAAALAELDTNAGLAEVGVEQGYVRPILDDSLAFEIRGGRHPVVEQALRKAKAHAFIENDCLLGRAEPAGDAPPGFEQGESEGESEPTKEASGRIWLVTGPNMAGKSTYLRQNALIALLAQAGSFVPARHAHIGVVDRLFSRVGASDDLARGRSTFMVEMVETAAIINQASERSLVVLDEIGRGTATFDGLSIAWATLEFLHDKARARTLFATHYHELTQLAGRLPALATVTMDVREWQDEIVFLHRVKPGAADRSYGIQVAKLAGLPDAVVKRAQDVLRRLERANRRGQGGERVLDELPLFAVPPTPPPAVPPQPSAIETALLEVDPDMLTPRAALELVYRLKAIGRGETKA
jgi:DNA mismatch repair protein MutS